MISKLQIIVTTLPFRRVYHSVTLTGQETLYCSPQKSTVKEQATSSAQVLVSFSAYNIIVFYISIQSAFQKDISVDIVLNGSIKVQAMTWYGSGSSVKIHQNGTNLVILHLQTSDRVLVKRSGGTGYFSNGTQEKTFSGFKLY